MSFNLNENEKNESTSSKGNKIIMVEPAIVESQEKEINNSKQLFQKKLYMSLYKKKKKKKVTKNNSNKENSNFYGNDNDDYDYDYVFIKGKEDKKNIYHKKNLSCDNIEYNTNKSNNFKNIYSSNISECSNSVVNSNEKKNLKKINEELLYNLELCENENIELKNVILQLNTELIEKEKYLEKSEKMIMELKENAVNLINQFEEKEIEYKNNILKNEDDISKESERKKIEIEKYKKENNDLKMRIGKLKIEYQKANKELKDMSLSFQELKQKSGNYIEMIKERERIISQHEIKIKELQKDINNKDAQLQILMKYKKEENPEQKGQNINVNDIIDNDNMFTKDNSYKVNIFPMDEQFDIKILENNIFNKKINFKLQDALKDILYIPSNANMSISKEYLIDMNFKTELVKTECFTNYIREFNCLQIFEQFSDRLDIYIIKDIVDKVHMLISDYERIKFDNKKYVNENNILKKRIIDLYLYIFKIKEEFYKANNGFKYKINDLITLYEMKINKIKNILNKENKMNVNLINYNNTDNYTSNTNINQINTTPNNYSYEHTNSFYYRNNDKLNGNLNPKINLIDSRYITTNNIKYYRNRGDNISHSSLSFKINNNMNNSLFNNGASTMNENTSYQDKKIENEKLKSEIERYKNEISMLIKDINEQQKQISDFQKIKKLWGQIPRSIYNKIKSLILQPSSIEEKTKNVINNFFTFLHSFLSDDIDDNKNMLSDNCNNIGVAVDYEDLNKNIFSTSEYKKYLLIYQFSNINEIINVYYFIVNNSKKNLDKINLNKDTISESSSEQNIINHNIKEEIIKLKNEHIVNESFAEIIKNYLIVLEKIEIFSKDDNYKDNLNKIFNILKEGLSYRIDDLLDKDIFIRKLMIKLFEKIQFQ